MKSRIIEIVEFGQPKSLIQRINNSVTELIDTNILIEELNETLRAIDRDEKYSLAESLPEEQHVNSNGVINPDSMNSTNEISKEIEFIDFDDEDAKNKIEFALWSMGGSSDYRNDRERPYNGQSWTDEGKRGKTEVKGLTMRDIRDCLIKAMLLSSYSEKYLEEKEFSKCWDFSVSPMKPTAYLLERQDEPDYISCRVELGTWRPQDVYKINWDNIDPLAVARNLNLEIEKMMGIYPNVDKLNMGV